MFDMVTQRLRNLWEGALVAAPRYAGRLDDVDIVQARLSFTDRSDEPSGQLDHLWFELIERAPDGHEWRGYRVIKLVELRYLPQEVRPDAALIQKTAGMLRGLYAASVELVIIDFAVFDPPLGV